MQIPCVTRSLLPAALGLAWVLGSAPAEASEVVKLARLVITGKRLSAERVELVAVRRAAPPGRSGPEQAKTDGPAKEPMQALSTMQNPLSGASPQEDRGRAGVVRGLASFF